MVITSGHNVVPHHRQNRRRERPGSRTRRTIPHARKSHLQSCIGANCQLGIQDAHDTSFDLPSDKTKPSPLLRENFDQSWQRWKARQAEERAVAEMDKLQLEQEQIKLFGGDINDDLSLCVPMLRVVMDLFGESPSELQKAAAEGHQLRRTVFQIDTSLGLQCYSDSSIGKYNNPSDDYDSKERWREGTVTHDPVWTLDPWSVSDEGRGDFKAPHHRATLKLLHT